MDLRLDGAKLIFINRFFFPDHSATSQILTDLARHLAETGHEVCVITSRQRYEDPGAELPRREVVSNVRVYRSRTTRFGRRSLVGRAFDYASFYATSAWRLWRLTRPGDVVVAATDPPLLSVVAAVVAKMRRARLVNWLHDVFPEVAGALGLPIMQGQFGDLIRRVRDWSLRAAAMNVVLGQREAAFLTWRGVSPEHIALIHNWSDDAQVVPTPKQENRLRDEWGLEGRFVVEYSGNMGRTHEFKTILDAAELLAHRAQEDVALSKIVFLFIGGGYHFPKVQAEAESRGLQNVLFKPYQPRERLVESLGLGDVHLISLLPEVEGLIVPSKFYGIAASGRPTLFIGAADGEIASLVERGACGARIAPGNAQELANWIVRLQADVGLLERMGVNARAFLDRSHSQKHALKAWREVLDDVKPEYEQ